RTPAIRRCATRSRSWLTARPSAWTSAGASALSSARSRTTSEAEATAVEMNRGPHRLRASCCARPASASGGDVLHFPRLLRDTVVRALAGARQQQRPLAPADRLAADDALLHVRPRRDFVHDFHQRVFEHGAQAARARLVPDGLLGAGLEPVVREYQL